MLRELAFASDSGIPSVTGGAALNALVLGVARAAAIEPLELAPLGAWVTTAVGTRSRPELGTDKFDCDDRGTASFLRELADAPEVAVVSSTLGAAANRPELVADVGFEP